VSLTFHWTRVKLGRAGRVETFVDHHGPDDVGRAAGQFSLFEPAIGWPDTLAGNSLRLQSRSKQANGGIGMTQIGARLASLPLLCPSDDAGARLPATAGTTWLSAMIQPRSRPNRGDYHRQVRNVSARCVVRLRQNTTQLAQKERTEGRQPAQGRLMKGMCFCVRSFKLTQGSLSMAHAATSVSKFRPCPRFGFTEAETSHPMCHPQPRSTFCD